jgi:hypothetical protein
LLIILIGLSFLLSSLLTPAFLEAQVGSVIIPSNQPDPLSAKAIISETASLTPNQATNLALNSIETNSGGFSLSNPATLQSSLPVGSSSRPRTAPSPGIGA